MNKLKFVLCSVLVLFLCSMPGYGTTEYEWNFGDGQTSNKKDPIHMYDNWGKYDWTLTVTQNGDVCVKQGTISINHYEWNFGDGNFSYEKSPRHQYTVPGVYNWSFTFTDCHGESCTTSGIITITGPPSILTLTSPNGGENLLPFTNFDITWNQENVSNSLKITLLKDGEEDRIIAYDIDPDSGSYSWVVATYEGGTAPTGTGYKIKLEENETGLSDSSDAHFTISNQSVISVISPNGGENWLPGSIENITWTASNVSSTVEITLWQNGSSRTIADHVDPLSGSYPWTVGDYMGGTAQTGQGYTICVKEEGTTIEDCSNVPFTILSQPTIVVTSPNGGETWSPNQIRKITWNISEVTSTLKIILWKNRVLQGPIVEDLPPYSTDFEWTVGNYGGGPVAQGQGFAIEITDQGASAADTSDESFIISDWSTIKVISPNGGETWSKGLTHEITWESNEIITTFEITLWKNDVLLGTIEDNLPSTTTSYSWTVGSYQGGTASPGTGYTIKIIEEGTTVSDISDSSFSIFDNY